MEKIISIAKRELNKVQAYKKLCIITSSVIFPIIEAILLATKDKISPQDPEFFWYIIGFVAILHLLFSGISISGAQLVQLVYFEARDIFERNKDLSQQNLEAQKQIEYLALLQECALVWRVMQRKYAEKDFSDPEEIKEALDEILTIVVNNRDRLFGFEVQELWNFAIYIYDKNADLLKTVWREKHENHPSGGRGREWKRDEGHIGVAFVQKEPKITRNANDPDVQEIMFVPPTNARSYDAKAYRSFASIPIGPIGIRENPLGVLVATSDRVGRFNKGNCLILRHSAAVIANLIHLNKIEIQNFLALRLNSE